MNRMTLLTLALAVALPLLGGAPLAADEKEDAVKKELKTLEGDWELVSQVYDGKDSPPAVVKDTVLTFKGDGVTFKSKDGSEKAAIKVDPGKTPKMLDLTPQEGRDRGKTFPSIYEIKGDELRVCGSQPGMDRPTEFSAKGGSGWTLMTLKRVKK